MTKHRFEIVRQTHDRYSWLFVEVQDSRRRVLARADRDYGSPKKVRRAIQKLQGAVPDADVADATGSTEPERFALPATSFQLVPGVVPLVVEEFPVERDIAVVRRRKPKRAKEAAKAVVLEDAAEQEAAKAVVLEDAAEQEAAKAVVLEDAAEQEAAKAVVLEDAAEQEAAKAVVLEDAAEQEAAKAVVLEDAAEQEAAKAVVLEDAAEQEAAKAKAPSRAGRRRKAT